MKNWFKRATERLKRPFTGIEARPNDEPVADQKLDVSDFAKVLADMVLDKGKNLSGDLLKTLRESGGWPFDLGSGQAHSVECSILDSWSIAYAFTNVKAPIALSVEMRDRFLREVEETINATLLGVGATHSSLSQLWHLAQSRYHEYWKTWNAHLTSIRGGGSNFDFVRAVTSNLFGVETNDIEVVFKTLACTGIHLKYLMMFFKETRLHERIAQGPSSPLK